MNVWEAMQQELVNFNQFWYHVTPALIFQVKSWSDSTFCCCVHWELVSTQDVKISAAEPAEMWINFVLLAYEMMACHFYELVLISYL